MLVVTRKRGEALVIGEGEKAVTVTVVDIDTRASAGRSRARLGVTAAPDVEVWREEIRPPQQAEEGGGNG